MDTVQILVLALPPGAFQLTQPWSSGRARRGPGTSWGLWLRGGSRVLARATRCLDPGLQATVTVSPRSRFCDRSRACVCRGYPAVRDPHGTSSPPSGHPEKPGGLPHPWVCDLTTWASVLATVQSGTPMGPHLPRPGHPEKPEGQFSDDSWAGSGDLALRELPAKLCPF